MKQERDGLKKKKTFRDIKEVFKNKYKYLEMENSIQRLKMQF